jgi:CheY-like chemotaxis protein
MTSPKSVLVVDDDPDVRETLEDVLRMAGYEVATAQHGRDGLALLEVGLRPGLILLDLMMPVMDGYGFLEALGSRPHLPVCPVIVVSANQDTARARAMPVVVDVLAKPFEIEELLRLVRQRC